MGRCSVGDEVSFETEKEGVTELEAARRYLANARTLRSLNNLWPFLKWSWVAYLVYYIAEISFEKWLNWSIVTGRGAVAFEHTFIVSTLISIFGTVVSITAIVAYCRFMHRAMNNVHVVVGAEGLVSPPGTWAWHLAPIFNFYLPYRAGREIWFHSRAHAGMTPEIPMSCNLWWAGWVSSFFLGTGIVVISVLIAPLGVGIVESIAYIGAYANLRFLISNSLHIIGTLAFLRFTSRINAAQLNFEDEGLTKIFS